MRLSHPNTNISINFPMYMPPYHPQHYGYSQNRGYPPHGLPLTGNNNALPQNLSNIALNSSLKAPLSNNNNQNNINNNNNQNNINNAQYPHLLPQQQQAPQSSINLNNLPPYA